MYVMNSLGSEDEEIHIYGLTGPIQYGIKQYLFYVVFSMTKYVFVFV